ncbi:MAG: hypothetical protein GF320_06455 [Armatimonadia bacterium]|nr:hypothetical protein [Armatimonadia bacterium]
MGRTVRRNRVGYEQTYFEFDANGNRTAMADQQGRWEFTFDSLDRVTNRTDPASKSFEWACGPRPGTATAEGGDHVAQAGLETTVGGAQLGLSGMWQRTAAVCYVHRRRRGP